MANVQYWDQGKVASETGLPFDVVQRTFEAARSYPRLQIKKKDPNAGCLCVFGPNTMELFFELARIVNEGVDISPTMPDFTERPQCVVPIGEFACACEKSIASARNITKCNADRRYENLMRYTIDVEAGGRVARIRLDLACALVKRIEHLPVDAYGEEIAGAMTSSDQTRWIIAYDTSEQIGLNSPNSGNIDHLIPRAAGGASTLCNFHVMRMESNSRKSAQPMPDISGEPQESIKVLQLLARGCSAAMKEGRLGKPLGDRMLEIVQIELMACLEMLETKDVLTLAAKVTARHAVVGLLRKMRNTVSSIRSVPRQMVLRMATNALSEA